MAIIRDNNQHQTALPAGASTEEYLVAFAGNTINYFEAISARAEARLSEGRPASTSALAAVNTLTYESALRNLTSISGNERENCDRLRSEPAIARVVLLDEEDRPQTMFITRATPPPLSSEGCLVASYKSPMGRLAAMPVGADEDITTLGGLRSYFIAEKAALRPARTMDGWDAADTVVERDGEIPVTVVSLFALLKSQGVSDDALNLLDSLLREDAAKTNVYDGIRRSVIDKMGLRDRPLLDQYQDQIFRLPLGTQLAIMGPPGSGKTTTLVKRLGQKLDLEYLDEDEHKTVRGTTAGEKGHAKSWLMFTPNELLRLYVREAFAREDVPASDLHIQTWVDYRRELGRQRLGILRTTTGTGGVMREGLQSLQENTISDTIRWYEDFQTWQAAAFWDELSAHAQRLSENTDGRVRRLGTQLKRVVEEEISGSRISSLNKLLDRSGAVTELAAELRKAIDDRLGQAFSAQLLKNKELLDELASFQASLGDASESLDDLDDLEGDDEEEEERQPQSSNRQGAFDAYKRAARAQARAAVVGRAVGRRTRNGRVLEWLGDRSLSKLDRQEIGSLLLVVDSLRRFSNPVGHYLNRIPQRYRRFRRQRQAEKVWYSGTTIPAVDLHPLEVDVLILAFLRTGAALLARISHGSDV